MTELAPGPQQPTAEAESEPIGPSATACRPSLRALGIYGVLALLLLLLFAGMARWYSGIPWSLPLDDPFIYLQYARQLAHGHPFQYNTGDPVTSGGTSPLYVLTLVPGFWLGLDGLRMVPYLLLLGLAGLVGSAWWMHHLAARWLGPRWGWWAGVLLLLCGPILWGAFSGMEIALFMLLILWLLARADRVLERAASPRSLLLPASLTAIWRPEGWLLVAGLALVVVIARAGAPGRQAPDSTELPFDRPVGRQPAGDRSGRAASDAGWGALALGLGLPLLVGLLPNLLFQLAGAGWTPAGVTAKSLWASAPRELPELLRQLVVAAIEILKGIFGGSLGARTSARLVAYDMNARAAFFAPLTFALFVFGLLPVVAGEIRRRLPARATLMTLWFLILLVTTASLVEADAHFNRYQMPIMPIFLLGAIIGAVRLGEWARRAVRGEAATHLAAGLLALLFLFGVASTLVFAVHYGDNASDIERMQVTMARVIDERLPADARVAINDAGILRYLSNRPTLDLVGLTSPGLARIWREGSGSLIEFFEHQPAAARPTHFAIFPNWFQLGESGLLEPIHAVSLQTPSIVDAEMVLYRARWDGLRAGDRPCDPAVVPAGHRIVDALDLADLADEARHRFVGWQRERGGDLRTVALRGACVADSLGAFVDGGRVLLGGATFEVSVQSGREVGILLRTRGGVRQRFSVDWNGIRVGEIDDRGAEGMWSERLVATVPAPLVREPAYRVTLTAATQDGGRRPIVPCQIWITQPESR